MLSKLWPPAANGSRKTSRAPPRARRTSPATAWAPSPELLLLLPADTRDIDKPGDGMDPIGTSAAERAPRQGKRATDASAAAGAATQAQAASQAQPETEAQSKPRPSPRRSPRPRRLPKGRGLPGGIGEVFRRGAALARAGIRGLGNALKQVPGMLRGGVRNRGLAQEPAGQARPARRARQRRRWPAAARGAEASARTGARRHRQRGQAGQNGGPARGAAAETGAAWPRPDSASARKCSSAPVACSRPAAR